MRTWTHILVFVHESFDVDMVVPFNSQGGAVVNYRDLNNPPLETTDPDTLEVIPGGWFPGRTSASTPPLSRAVGEFFCKRTNLPGRKGASILLYRLTGLEPTWALQITTAKAVIDALPDWNQLHIVILLLPVDSNTLNHIEATFDSSVIVQPAELTPAGIATAIVLSGI